MKAPLVLTVRCDPCGLLATGSTADKPSGRYATRWSELDALADRHTRVGHCTTVSARPPVDASGPP